MPVWSRAGGYTSATFYIAVSLSDYTRSRKLIRQMQLFAVLRRGTYTLAQMSKELGVGERTIRRDIYAMEAAHVPIVRTAHEDSRWGLMRGAPCPVCGGDKGRAHGPD